MLLATALWLYFAGPLAIERLRGLMRGVFSLAPPALLEETSSLLMLHDAAVAGLWLLAPLFALALLVALLGSIALGGWSFSSEAASFNWERLDPIRGLGRIFSWHGLMELVKALVKFAFVTGMGVLLLWLWSPRYLGLGEQSVEVALAGAAYLVTLSFVVLSGATMPIAFVDVLFQLWSHGRKLRMTRQELKEEFKETEGKPEIKAKVRALQREIAQRRMMEAVPRADVVVTNPTHFAVALRYEAADMRAPIVVAKGADRVALRIRELALESAVPVVSAPALARAVYFNVRVDQEIPVGLYLAVAQVLAYVYQIKERRPDGEAGVPFPHDLPVPDELLRPRRGRAWDPGDR
jgi:flagellar biosynthetic protein FlhB